MKTGVMRKIDYHVGIPACFLFSCFHKISRLLLRKDRAVGNPRKILFMKFFGFGTMILASPAIKRCKELYRDAEIHFLTFHENRPLFDLLNIAGDIKVITVKTSSVASFVTDMAKVLLRLRKERFDVVLDMEFFSRFSSVLSFLSRSRSRVGFHNPFIEGLYRGDFLTHKVFYNHYQHTSLAYLDMVETMKLGGVFPYNKIQYCAPPIPRDVGITFKASAEERRGCREKFGLAGSERLVLLNPNISEGFIDLRRWPLPHFAALAKRLLSDFPDLRIGIIGSGKDLPVARELEQLIGDARVSNLAARTSLAELCILLDSSHCLVTNDSGPAHLAALTDTRVITLFGPDTPMLFAPLARRSVNLFLQLGCSPCGSIYNGKRTTCRDNQCLKRITPEMVLAEAVKGL
jgi:lipopolysaccharide heptosyltransferase II